MSEWKTISLDDLISSGQIELGRGEIISKDDIQKYPGQHPIYSSSASSEGKFGEYGKYIFDEELISWSIDGGGNFFYRPKHKFSVTNVSGYLRIKNNKQNYKFLYYSLVEQHRNFTFDYMTKAHPSVIRKMYHIPIISEEYQNAIATILSTIDETIEHTEALIEKYQQIKAGMMNDLFTRGVLPDGTLRPTRDEAPELYQETPIGWIPKEWSVVRVQELCSNIVDCPHSTPVYLKEGYPCIRTADMIPGRLLLDNVYKVDKKTYLDRTSRLVPKKGDIIYSREGERLGIASPVCEDLVCLGQRVMMLRPSSETDPKYLMWAMNSSNFYRNVTSGTGATTSPHVNVGDIQRKNLPKPSLYEQKMIGLALHNIDQLLLEEEIGANKLQNQKSGLMHDLLTGKVRVKTAKE